jgi:hypothetical protein
MKTFVLDANTYNGSHAQYDRSLYRLFNILVCAYLRRKRGLKISAKAFDASPEIMKCPAKWGLFHVTNRTYDFDEMTVRTSSELCDLKGLLSGPCILKITFDNGRRIFQFFDGELDENKHS